MFMKILKCQDISLNILAFFFNISLALWRCFYSPRLYFKSRIIIWDLNFKNAYKIASKGISYYHRLIPHPNIQVNIEANNQTFEKLSPEVILFIPDVQILLLYFGFVLLPQCDPSWLYQLSACALF